MRWILPVPLQLGHGMIHSRRASPHSETRSLRSSRRRLSSGESGRAAGGDAAGEAAGESPAAAGPEDANVSANSARTAALGMPTRPNRHFPPMLERGLRNPLASIGGYFAPPLASDGGAPGDRVPRRTSQRTRRTTAASAATASAIRSGSGTRRASRSALTAPPNAA